MHQKKLFFERDFWKDLHRSISFLVRDLVFQPHVKMSWLVNELKKAGVHRCSEQLIYAWADPEKDQLPSLRAFLLLIKITENCIPVDTINHACGKKTMPENDYDEAVNALKVAMRGLNAAEH